MKTVRAVLWGVFIILLVLFVVQNLGVLSHSEPLHLNLLVVSLETPALPLFMLLALCLIIGFLVAYGLGYVQRRRLKKTIKDLGWRYNRAEEELKSLRNLPITGELTSDRGSRPPDKNGS